MKEGVNEENVTCGFAFLSFFELSIRFVLSMEELFRQLTGKEIVGNFMSNAK